MLECTELELEESPWLIAPIVLGAMTARRTAAGRSATVRHAVTACQSVMGHQRATVRHAVTACQNVIVRQGATVRHGVMACQSVMGHRGARVHRVVMARRSVMVVRLGRLGALMDTAVPAPLGLVGLIAPIGRRETTTVRATMTRSSQIRSRAKSSTASRATN